MVSADSWRESVQARTDIWSKKACGAVRADSDSKLVILNFWDELAVKNEELKRMKNNKDCWKKRSQHLSVVVRPEVARQNISLRPGPHVSTYGGCSLADRRSCGHTAAATASLVVTGDLGDTGIVRDPHSVMRFEHRATTAMTLRSRMFHGSAAASTEAEPQLQGQLAQQELISEKWRFPKYTPALCVANFSAEYLDLGSHVQSRETSEHSRRSRDRGRLATSG